MFSIRPGFPWKENFLLIAEAMGEEDEAVEILNAYQEQADGVGDAIDGDPTVSIVRFMPERLRLYGNASFIGVVLKDIGLRRPPIQDIDELAVEISPETIGEAEGDWIFYSSYGTPDATGENVVVNGPLWPTLGAVRSGEAERVSDELWFLALGPSGAASLLTELRGLIG